MTEPGADEERIDAEYYDRSGYFDDDTAHLTETDSPFQRYRVKMVFAIDTPKREERVVDLGCGWGTFSFALADRVDSVVGIDFSARSVTLCRERLAQEPHENLTFLQADARATGLDAASVDRVIAADLFEHLYPEDSQAVVDEAHRLLRPGGAFVIWTPHRGHILEILKNRNLLLRKDESHVDYKSMARLRAMLEQAGFQVERAYYAESHLPILRWIERATLPVLPWTRRRIAMLGRKPW